MRLHANLQLPFDIQVRPNYHKLRVNRDGRLPTAVLGWRAIAPKTALPVIRIAPPAVIFFKRVEIVAVTPQSQPEDNRPRWLLD